MTQERTAKILIEFMYSEKSIKECCKENNISYGVFKSQCDALIRTRVDDIYGVYSGNISFLKENRDHVFAAISHIGSFSFAERVAIRRKAAIYGLTIPEWMIAIVRKEISNDVVDEPSSICR
jgi:hypothetical protein